MHYKRNDIGISPKQYHWTPSAIDCLKRDMVCQGCFYNEYFAENNPKHKCQMKGAVLELVRTVGLPKEYEQKTFIDDSEIEVKTEIKVLPTIKKEQKEMKTETNPTNELASAGLTARENQVASAILDGKNKHEIAKELCIKVQSIPTYLMAIFNKTDAFVNYQTKKEKIREFREYFGGVGIINITEENNPFRDNGQNPPENDNSEVVNVQNEQENEQIAEVCEQNESKNEQSEMDNLFKNRPQTIEELVAYYNCLDKQIADCDNLVTLYQDKKEYFINEKLKFGKKLVIDANIRNIQG